MKVLIWVLTIVVGTIINTLIGYATGIKAGAVLLYIAEYFVAKKLCQKWDKHKRAKEADTVEISMEPMKSFELDTSNHIDTTDDPTISGQDKTTIPKTIKYCRHCGYKLVKDSEFCSNCGTKIEKETSV